MFKMILNHKFDVGDKVYTTIRKPIAVMCPVCSGLGKLEHQGCWVRCPHCRGTGKLAILETLCEAIEKPVTITRIKASIWSDHEYIVKYVINSMDTGENVKHRSEDKLFLTIEEARDSACKSNHPITEDPLSKQNFGGDHDGY